MIIKYKITKKESPADPPSSLLQAAVRLLEKNFCLVIQLLCP
jgi:hypothetical protein